MAPPLLDGRRSVCLQKSAGRETAEDTSLRKASVVASAGHGGTGRSALNRSSDIISYFMQALKIFSGLTIE